MIRPVTRIKNTMAISLIFSSSMTLSLKPLA